MAKCREAKKHVATKQDQWPLPVLGEQVVMTEKYNWSRPVSTLTLLTFSPDTIMISESYLNIQPLLQSRQHLTMKL